VSEVVDMGFSHPPSSVRVPAPAGTPAFEDLRSRRVRARSARVRTAFMTLGTVFPTPAGPSARPATPPDESGRATRRAASPGMSKDRPSVVPPARESTPGHRLRGDRRDGPASSRPRSALVVSHHLGGFLLPVPCARITARCRPWGSSRFRLARWPVARRESASPRCLSALRSLPTARSCRCRHLRARVTGADPRGPPPFTADLAPSPFRPARFRSGCSRPHPGHHVREGDHEAFLHERVRCRPGGFPPHRPGASLGLPGTPSSAR
jgi:hypothetical protein